VIHPQVERAPHDFATQIAPRIDRMFGAVSKADN
jgi:hypothetical protein